MKATSKASGVCTYGRRAAIAGQTCACRRPADAAVCAWHRARAGSIWSGFSSTRNLFSKGVDLAFK